MLDDRKKDYEEYKSTGIKTKYPTPAKYKEEYPYLKEIDRDYNASINILRKGLEILREEKNKLKNISGVGTTRRAW